MRIPDLTVQLKFFFFNKFSIDFFSWVGYQLESYKFVYGTEDVNNLKGYQNRQSIPQAQFERYRLSKIKYFVKHSDCIRLPSETKD